MPRGRNIADLTGKIFGELTVISAEGRNRDGRTLWRCRCSCPPKKERIVSSRKLISGKVVSCGCQNKRKRIIPEDFIGKTFGKLTVLSGAGQKENGERLFKCRCSCADEKETVVTGHNLNSQNTKSCGCLSAELIIKRNHTNKGRALSAEWRRKLSESGKGKQVGAKHYAWNPNREQVKFNKKIRQVVYTMLHRILKLTNQEKTCKTEIAHNYKHRDLIRHITSLLPEGLGWEKYGNKRGCWSIDHIKPVSAYIREGITDPAIINKLDNLRPILHSDNLSKHCIYNPPLRHRINLLSSD